MAREAEADERNRSEQEEENRERRKRLDAEREKKIKEEYARKLQLMKKQKEEQDRKRRGLYKINICIVEHEIVLYGSRRVGGCSARGQNIDSMRLTKFSQKGEKKYCFFVKISKRGG
jgi:hypothetical protein